MAFVQIASASHGGSPGTSTFTTAPTVGNIIYVMVATWNGTAALSSVVDNKGNSYTRQASRLASNAGIELWTATVTSTGSGFAVTGTLSGADFNIVAEEWSGYSATKDQTANTVNVASPMTITTPTLSSATQLVFATCSHGMPNMPYPTSGYTNRSIQADGTSTMGYTFSDKEVTSTTAVSATWTGYTSVGGEVASLIVTFPSTVAPTFYKRFIVI